MTPCHFKTLEHNDVISEIEKAQRLTDLMIHTFS